MNTGDTTTVIGGAIGSQTSDFELTTENLELEDFIERERSHSVGINLSVSPGQSDNSDQTSTNNQGLNPNDSGGEGFDVSGVGGAFSSAELDGVAEATLGEGIITVGNETAEETRARLAEVNSDINND